MVILVYASENSFCNLSKCQFMSGVIITYFFIDKRRTKKPKIDLQLPLPSFHNYHKDPATEPVSIPEDTINPENPAIDNPENNAINDAASDNPEAGPEIQIQLVNVSDEEIDAKLLEILSESMVSTDIKETEKLYQAELRLKEKQIEALKGQISRMQPKVDVMSKIFNPDQVYKMLHPETTSKWSELTIEHCLTFYYLLSTSGYQFLIKRGYPLVSISVLQRYMRKIISGPGIQYHVIKVLAKKVEIMPPKARYCTLVIDEMEIKATREYDCSTGKIIGTPTIAPSDKVLANRAKKPDFNPQNLLASKCFNGKVAGLLDRWSQLVFFTFTEKSFNKKAMAKELKELISLLLYIKLDVCCFTMDMGMIGL